MISLLKADSNYAIREFQIEDDPHRNNFLRDRDRILFSKEFRRLGGKTQVFINGFDDHIRNRLTHTLEVAQIAQTLAHTLGLDEDLCTAISFAHDVGHTPFGHTGERILNHFTNNCDPKNRLSNPEPEDFGFKHNWQGLKVVSSLEKVTTRYNGLNLTNFTKWGILNHSKLKYNPCDYKQDEKCTYLNCNRDCISSDNEFQLSHYEKYNIKNESNSWTIEGLIVGVADEIAQRHHDVEDGLLAGIIKVNDFIDSFKGAFNSFLRERDLKLLKNIKNSSGANSSLHDISSLILNFYSHYLIENSKLHLHSLIIEYKINNINDFYNKKKEIHNEMKIQDLIDFELDFKTSDKIFTEFLSKKIIFSHLAQSMDGKANYILRKLINAYMINPNQLPDGTVNTLLENYSTKINDNHILSYKNNRDMINTLSRENNSKFQLTLARTITDFIAGMTDSFAIAQFRLLYGTKNNWHY